MIFKSPDSNPSKLLMMKLILPGLSNDLRNTPKKTLGLS